MKRSTKKIDRTGTDGPNVPTSKPGDISKHPAMIELKRLVAQLPANRKAALGEFLDREPEDALSLLVEAAEAITEGINLMVMASLDGYMPQSWGPLRDRISIFLESQHVNDDDDS